MTTITGLCGEAGAGKDTVAELLIEAAQGKAYSFAGAVYKLAAAMLGTSVEYLQTRSTKEIVQTFWVTQRTLEDMCDLYVDYGFDVKYDLFPSIWYAFRPQLDKYIQPYTMVDDPADAIFILHISPRKALELVGTEFGRELLSEQVWTDLVVDSIRKDDAPLAVITDVRFPNEVDLVKELGGRLWKVVRPDNPNRIVSTHPSALGIPDEHCDVILYNDVEGLDNLRQKVDSLMSFSG